MAIYEPIQHGAGIYSGDFGRERPTSGNWANFKPKFSRGRGRFGGVISAGYRTARYFKKNRNAYTVVGSIAAGAGIRHATSGKYQKAFHPGKYLYNSSRRNSKRRTCCCCTRPRPNSISRGKRRLYY